MFIIVPPAPQPPGPGIAFPQNPLPAETFRFHGNIPGPAAFLATCPTWYYLETQGRFSYDSGFSAPENFQRRPVLPRPRETQAHARPREPRRTQADRAGKTQAKGSRAGGKIFYIRKVIAMAKERFSVTLDARLVKKIRSRFPGVPLSQALALLAEKSLQEGDIDRRLRNLEAVCRADALMLADYIAEGDETEARRLLNSFVQQALSRMKEAKRRADQERPAPGPGES